MNGKELKIYFLSAFFTVPTGALDGWKELGFNKIPQNTVSVTTNKTIKIDVNQSASPLIYKLSDIKKVSALSAKWSATGELAKLNSSTFPEDFLMRIGLVAKGDQRLSWFQKKIAANWVLELFSLAPANIGLDKIYFYNIATSKELVGQKRQHPKSDLMLEEVIASFPETKSITHKLTKPLDVVALWISVDGDDTKSKFSTTIEELILEVLD